MNDITALREALFATLNGLRDKDKPLEIERAKAINETAQTIINSAKVEVDYLRHTGSQQGTGFMALGDATAPATTPNQGNPNQTGSGVKQITEVPGGRIVQHRMR